MPFLLLALGARWTVRTSGWLRRNARTIQLVGGGLLFVVGVLLVTGLWGELTSWLKYAVITDTELPAVIAFLRNTWRGLTSMRTALVLLFLLALAALPGALLPQRSLNSTKVDEYIASHGWWGELLGRLEFYNVYGSVWFSADLPAAVHLAGRLPAAAHPRVREVRCAASRSSPRATCPACRTTTSRPSTATPERGDGGGAGTGSRAGAWTSARRRTAPAASPPNAATCARPATSSSTSPCSA